MHDVSRALELPATSKDAETNRMGSWHRSTNVVPPQNLWQHQREHAKCNPNIATSASLIAARLVVA